MSLNQLLQKGSVIWHGVKLNQPDWSQQSHSIAFTIESLGGRYDDALYAECIS